MEGNGLTAEKMISAIKEAKGIVSDACKILNCSRQHFYNKMREFTTVQQTLESIREQRTDYVEGQMMRLIDELNPTMIIFYLKTQAKNRGYIERSEVSGPDGSPIKTESVMIYIPDNGRH